MYPTAPNVHPTRNNVQPTAPDVQPTRSAQTHQTAPNTASAAEKRSFSLGELPSFRLSKLLKKPVLLPDGALLQLGGVTFSLNGGKIKHLIVRLSPVLCAESPVPFFSAVPSTHQPVFSPSSAMPLLYSFSRRLSCPRRSKNVTENGSIPNEVDENTPTIYEAIDQTDAISSVIPPTDNVSATRTSNTTADSPTHTAATSFPLSNACSELYLPFADAKLSGWHVTPSSARPRSPKGTARLTLGKSVYSTGGTYYGNLTDAVITHGRLSLLCVGDRTFAAENLFAVGDAVLLRPALPYPLGQSIPASFRVVNATESSNAPFKTRNPVAVRLPDEVTKSALQYFLRTGQLVAFTTSLPLFHTQTTESKA